MMNIIDNNSLASFLGEMMDTTTFLFLLLIFASVFIIFLNTDLNNSFRGS